MKICMVSRDFLPNTGGIASHVYELSKALVKDGHQVHVVKTGYGVNPRLVLEDLDGIQVHRLFYSGRVRGWRFLALLRRARRYLRDLVQREKIDIIHWHELESSSFETKFLRVKAAKVFTNHSSRYLEMVQHGWKKRYLGLLLGHADCIIAPSEELANKSAWINYPAKQVIYIPNGVDIDKFSPAVDGRTFRQKMRLGERTVLVLCPRRLQPKNGVIYLVRAIPSIKKASRVEIRFYVAGGGYPDERKRIEQQSVRDGTSADIVFAGSVSNEQMPQLYAAADLVVLPSLMEAVSIAGLEGMASEKPLVGTTVGGLPALIDQGKTGLLVPPRDPHALAEAIVALAHDPGNRYRMGKAGRKKVEMEFNWTSVAHRVLEVYRAVV